jgi:hypothetical protein
VVKALNNMSNMEREAILTRLSGVVKRFKPKSKAVGKSKINKKITNSESTAVVPFNFNK